MRLPSVARVLEDVGLICLPKDHELIRTVAVTMFLCSEEPLMKRCLSTGGAVLLFKPIPEPVTESAYQAIIQALGLADKSPQERIDTLLSMPADDLWQKVPMGAPLLPAIDGEIVPGAPGFATVASKNDDPSFLMPGRKWCSALMIGESALDVSACIKHEHYNSVLTFSAGQHSSIHGPRRPQPRHRKEIHQFHKRNTLLPTRRRCRPPLRIQHHRVNTRQ